MRPGIEFHSADISNYKLDDADVIIVADTLHYLNEENQRQVLKECNNAIKPGGLILIRDGLIDDKNGHGWTVNSEKWSTKYLRFNKSTGDVHFFSSSFIKDWAYTHGYSCDIDQQSVQSSNALMILTKLSDKLE